MLVICEKCHRRYDNAEQWTLCPHGPLWAAADAYCPVHDLVNCQICVDEQFRVQKWTRDQRRRKHLRVTVGKIVHFFMLDGEVTVPMAAIVTGVDDQGRPSLFILSSINQKPFWLNHVEQGDTPNTWDWPARENPMQEQPMIVQPLPLDPINLSSMGQTEAPAPPEQIQEGDGQGA